MLDDFLIRTIIAGCLIALSAGPLGCFMIWQRKAYFADSLAHVAILGVAFSILFNLSFLSGIIFILTIFSLLLYKLERMNNLSNDTILAILSYSLLSIGLLLISLQKDTYFNLDSFLFGNILAISKIDIYSLLIADIIILSFLKIFWEKFLLISLNIHLAQNETKYVKPLIFAFNFMLALFIALTIKILGFLLINALLIIASSSARQCSKSPLQMVLCAIAIALLAMMGGIFVSYHQDVATGPVIVTILFSCFITILTYRKLRGLL